MRKESIRFYIYGIILLTILLVVSNRGDSSVHPALVKSNGATKLNSNSKTKFLFVGVLTMISKYNRRALIRGCYMRDIPEGIDVKFIFGKPKNEFEQNLLDMEGSLYNDIVVLDNEENLDDGKTYHFMKWAGGLQGYEFLLKTDDDVFLHLNNLNNKLKSIKSELNVVEGVYYGRHVPNTIFMAGMGYVLSFDLVYYIANDAYAKQNIKGQEDGLVASWLKHGNKIKHFKTEDVEVRCIYVVL